MIQHDPLEFPDAQWSHLSEEARDFCRSLMQKKPSKRLSATDAKKHPWIVGKSTVHAGPDAAHIMEKANDIIDSLEAFAKADGLAKVALQVIAFSTPPSKMEE